MNRITFYVQYIGELQYETFEIISPSLTQNGWAILSHLLNKLQCSTELCRESKSTISHCKTAVYII